MDLLFLGIVLILIVLSLAFITLCARIQMEVRCDNYLLDGWYNFTSSIYLSVVSAS